MRAMEPEEVVELVGEVHGPAKATLWSPAYPHPLVNWPRHVPHDGRLADLPEPHVKALAAVKSGGVRIHLPLPLLVGEAVAHSDLHGEDRGGWLGLLGVFRRWFSSALLTHSTLRDPRAVTR
jgi:hypothetical protein